MRVLFIILIFAFCHVSSSYGCWIIHRVVDTELAEWPLPALIEVKPVGLVVPGSKQPLVCVSIHLIEDKLKRADFGAVKRISLRHYGSDPDSINQIDSWKKEIERSKGKAEIIVTPEELPSLRLVIECNEVPKFQPCAGGDLIYVVDPKKG